MLEWFENGSQIFEMPHTRQKFFNNGKKNLSQDEFENIKSYVNKIIDKVLISKSDDNKFFVPGWEATGSWENTPLQTIWEKVYRHDHENCALWYGLLVMEVLIERNEDWKAIKTNYNKDFEQMTYWTNDDCLVNA